MFEFKYIEEVRNKKVEEAKKAKEKIKFPWVYFVLSIALAVGVGYFSYIKYLDGLNEVKDYMFWLLICSVFSMIVIKIFDTLNKVLIKSADGYIEGTTKHNRSLASFDGKVVVDSLKLGENDITVIVSRAGKPEDVSECNMAYSRIVWASVHDDVIELYGHSSYWGGKVNLSKVVVTKEEHTGFENDTCNRLKEWLRGKGVEIEGDSE